MAGGLVGGTGGAAGAASSAVVAPLAVSALNQLEVPSEVARPLVLITGMAAGGLTGGGAGAMTGLNETNNNAAGSLLNRGAAPMLRLCATNVSCAAYFASAAGGSALLAQISNRADEVQRDNPGLSSSAAFNVALAERVSTSVVNTIGNLFAPAPIALPNNTGNATPAPNYAGPLITPTPLVTGPNHTGGTQLDQPAQPVTTVSPASVPVAGSNVITTPIATPAGVGIVMSQNGQGGNGAVTSGGTANLTTGPKLNQQLANENLANIGAQDPRLASAVNGSGTNNPNFSIGSGTATEANRLGEIWVGDGARPLNGVPGGLLSADGTRVYRPPTIKTSTPAQFNPTGVQANFQTRDPSTGATTSNGHMVIK